MVEMWRPEQSRSGGDEGVRQVKNGNVYLG